MLTARVSSAQGPRAISQLRHRRVAARCGCHGRVVRTGHDYQPFCLLGAYHAAMFLNDWCHWTIQGPRQRYNFLHKSECLVFDIVIFGSCAKKGHICRIIRGSYLAGPCLFRHLFEYIGPIFHLLQQHLDSKYSRLLSPPAKGRNIRKAPFFERDCGGLGHGASTIR